MRGSGKEDPGAIFADGRDNPLDAIRALAIPISFRRGERIYEEGGSADHWYRVAAGMARKYTLSADGRRQIVDFFFPGDFFGFTARDRRVFSVEAVSNGTVVARYPRRRIERMADSDPLLSRRIRELSFEAISRMQFRMLILGRMTAMERVWLFLIEVSERSRGGAADAVALPMSRHDIADYLALSVETVCRALTDLKQSGAIRLAGAHGVTIIDGGALQERQRRTATG